jgi:3-dehydroquinate dehydratase-2
MKQLHIINGPNLNLLGEREVHIYGSQSFSEYAETLCQQFAGRCELHFFQSNIEGEIINYIHQVRKQSSGIIINAGAYTHTSIAIADAIAAVQIPTIEVHISNIYNRESFRQHSYLTRVCKGSICGLGLDSYRLAVEHLLGQ